MGAYVRCVAKALAFLLLAALVVVSVAQWIRPDAETLSTRLIFRVPRTDEWRPVPTTDEDVEVLLDFADHAQTAESRRLYLALRRHGFEVFFAYMKTLEALPITRPPAGPK